MERIWGVVAAGDIRGAGIWTSRAANSPETKEPFIRKFYELMDAYVVKHKDIDFKRVGDGFIALKEIEQSEWKAIVDFILSIRCLCRKVKKEIETCRWPPPDGFRVRFTSGDLYKISVVDESDPERKRTKQEFFEYPTNMACHLLNVSPTVFAIATEGVVKSMNRGALKFSPRVLAHPSFYPLSVNKEDIDGLKVLRF